MSLDRAAADALAGLLRRNVGIERVRSVEQLSGGASRQTYAISAERSGATAPADYILQREMAEPRLEGGMASEADLVTAARRAGVPAPVVVGTNRDGAEDLGPSFFITEQVPGETIARRILRDDRFERARRVLPAQLGQALAALHTKVAPADVHWLETTDELAKYREAADELDLVSPAFELGFRWLAANQPPRPSAGEAVVHGDFRLGNLIVDDDGLAAVIDWELGHLGDPMEDLGWLCVRAWRFGGPGPVAGVGSYDQLFEAYEQASGTAVEPDRVRWWQILGTLKWGVMCALQSNRHLSGTTPSMELAAIGPRVAEQEYDLMQLIHPELKPDDKLGEQADDQVGVTRSTHGPEAPATGLAEGGGRPSVDQLIEAVRDYLLADVSDATEGRTRFHALVAANVLSTVSRDLEHRPRLADHRQRRLDRLGVADERALASAIRSGELEGRPDVAEAVMQSVADRLSINNPGWFETA